MGAVVTTGRWRHVGASVFTALALAGCASQACTTIGCQTSVSVDVSAVQDLGSTQAGRIKVCVGSDENCVLALAPKGQSVVEAVFPAEAIPGPSMDMDKPVTVTVSVMNPGHKLVNGSVDATFTKLAPNGETCGPVCYTVRLAATDRGVSVLPLGASASSSG
jgi:hypothetical protein